ncbi:MAG TPA: hypothetical protein VIK33_10860 [Anaerolineae bacterium]
MDDPQKMRKQTPRIPSNVVYDRIVPIAFMVMGVLLVAIIMIAIAGLVNAIR